jgi:hypothetical protein
MTRMQTVLSEIDRYAEDGGLKEFSLDYITKDGRRKHCARLCKGGKLKAAPRSGNGRAHFNIKQKGILMLWNNETRKYESPLIALITHFNGIRVCH